MMFLKDSNYSILILIFFGFSNFKNIVIEKDKRFWWKEFVDSALT